jgi:hypothetical protein
MEEESMPPFLIRVQGYDGSDEEREMSNDGSILPLIPKRTKSTIMWDLETKNWKMSWMKIQISESRKTYRMMIVELGQTPANLLRKGTR